MNFGGYFSSLFAGTPSWVTNSPLRWDSHRRQAAFQASSHASCSCTRVAPCSNPTFEPKQTKTRSHWDLVSSARRRWDSKTGLKSLNPNKIKENWLPRPARHQFVTMLLIIAYLFIRLLRQKHCLSYSCTLEFPDPGL